MKTRVLVVEDNALIQKFYEKALRTLPDVELVGIASDGLIGLDLVKKMDPDVIICDLNMPNLDGFEFTRICMEDHPKPILIVSDLVQKDNEQNIFRIFQLGAIDILPKPRVGGDIEKLAKELSRKINILKGVVVFQKKKSNSGDLTSKLEITKDSSAKHINFSYLAIGASTGGPQALTTVLAMFPTNFKIPILCVQHISTGFSDNLISWLQSNIQCNVEYAKNNEIPKPATIYFAPDGFHLGLRKGLLILSEEEPIGGHRPSVDYLFHSMAQETDETTLAVILTGMGKDGAKGLKDIRDNGGFTIAQDEATSIVYGMPKVAKEIGAAMEILPLNEIGIKILSLVM